MIAVPGGCFLFELQGAHRHVCVILLQSSYSYCTCIAEIEQRSDVSNLSQARLMGRLETKLCRWSDFSTQQLQQ